MSVRERVLAGLLAAALAVALSGCGGDGEPEPGGQATTGPDPSASATSAPATAAPSPTEEPVELFEFEITDGRAEPPLQRSTVEQGASVRIVVASDQPDELHLHGYDLVAPITADEPGVIEFVADQTGQFELETHDSHIVLLQLLVR